MPGIVKQLSPQLLRLSGQLLAVFFQGLGVHAEALLLHLGQHPAEGQFNLGEQKLHLLLLHQFLQNGAEVGQNGHSPAFLRPDKLQLGQILHRQLLHLISLGGDAEQVGRQLPVPHRVQLLSQTPGQLIAGFGLKGALGLVAAQHQGLKGLGSGEGEGVDGVFSHHQQAGIGEKIVHHIQPGQILFGFFQGFRSRHGIFHAVGHFRRGGCVLPLLQAKFGQHGKQFQPGEQPVQLLPVFRLLGVGGQVLLHRGGEADGAQLPAEVGAFFSFGEQLFHPGGELGFLQMGVQLIQAAELLNQAHGSLFPDALHPGDVVAGIPH